MYKNYNTYTRKHGYAYTRYADDLNFSGIRPPEAGFFESVTRIAGEHGFTPNRRKTRVRKSTSRQTVTGIVANQKPNVDCEYLGQGCVHPTH